MSFEKYWRQTQEKWEGCVENPRSPAAMCGFCDFAAEEACDFCPVYRVYGVVCEEVESVRAYYDGWTDRDTDAEDLSLLAKAVIQELDNKKEELVAAMRDLWEEVNE